MIKVIKVENAKHANIHFKDHELAHKYLDGLQGIEIGPAAHNPFNLKGSTAVGLGPDKDINDYRFFQRAQIDMCGEYCEIDVSGEAEKIPLPSGSQDYVITSHVIEHLPNPILAFKEWYRLLKPDGIMFSIVPLRNALPSDSGREITTLDTFIRAYKEQWTVNTVPHEYEALVPGGRRGHYFVYTHQSFVELLNYCKRYRMNWEVLEVEEIDTKVGNGFTVVAKKAGKTTTAKES